MSRCENMLCQKMDRSYGKWEGPSGKKAALQLDPHPDSKELFRHRDTRSPTFTLWILESNSDKFSSFTCHQHSRNVDLCWARRQPQFPKRHHYDSLINYKCFRSRTMSLYCSSACLGVDIGSSIRNHLCNGFPFVFSLILRVFLWRQGWIEPSNPPYNIRHGA